MKKYIYIGDQHFANYFQSIFLQNIVDQPTKKAKEETTNNKNENELHIKIMLINMKS